jgi:haloalkane dehalogenase
MEHDDTSSPHAPAWLDRNLYPFAAHRFASGQGDMHYVDEGHGRPLLFVHGTPSWSFEWRNQILALRDRYRCVAPDHLGFGLSDKPIGAGYEPEHHAQRLLDLVRALDLRDLSLIVHDFGGPIGLPILLREPERVSSLVLINTWLWPHGDTPQVQRVSRLIASPLGRLLYLGLNASPRWLVPASFARRSRLTKPIHRHYIAPFPTRAQRHAPFVLGRELAGSDPFYAQLWSDRAALHRIPTTVIWGMRDPAFGPAYLARWQAELPDARVAMLEDAGHFPQEEAPEQVTAALEAALAVH